MNPLAIFADTTGHGSPNRWKTILYGILAILIPAGSPGMQTVSQGINRAVTVYKPDKFYRGYTLCSSRQSQRARLIDMKGNVVHDWQTDITIDSLDREYPEPRGFNYHYAEMLPNGHLVAISKNHFIHELNWHGKRIWKYETRAHHDFDRLENGNTIILGLEAVYNRRVFPDTAVCDYLIEVTRGGDIVWEWHAIDHIDAIKRRGNMSYPFPNRDLLHINTVEVLRENILGKKDPRFRAGNILMSMRRNNTIAVIDKRSGEIVWSWGPGILDGQHMPTLLDNGNIMVYDNGSRRGYTRVLEYNVLQDSIVWEYTADPPESFFSNTRGSSQRLPNENTLTGDADAGIIFEVTMEGEVVWRYVNPDTRRDGTRDHLYRVIRYCPGLVERLLQQH